MDSSFCKLIAGIQKDPHKKIENLTVGQFYGLQQHIKTCQTCSDIVDNIIETNKDVPDSGSAWDQTKYN